MCVVSDVLSTYKQSTEWMEAIGLQWKAIATGKSLKDMESTSVPTTPKGLAKRYEKAREAVLKELPAKPLPKELEPVLFGHPQRNTSKFERQLLRRCSDQALARVNAAPVERGHHR